MKISINNEPFLLEDDEIGSENFKLQAELSSDEDANIIDVTKMFVKAATIEGYHMQSIIKSLIEVAKYEAFNYNIDIKPYLTEQEESDDV